MSEALTASLNSTARGTVQSKDGSCVAGTTIGKRYARTDELGIPFAITVDRDTLEAGDKQGTVTLRERDSTLQVGLVTCPCFRGLQADHTRADTTAGLYYRRQAAI